MRFAVRTCFKLYLRPVREKGLQGNWQWHGRVLHCCILLVGEVQDKVKVDLKIHQAHIKLRRKPRAERPFLAERATDLEKLSRHYQ